jgi:hypothetical protein
MANGMIQTLASQMYATGSKSVPTTLQFGQRTYTLSTVLKDDFFATTAAYHRPEASEPDWPQRIVLKVNRREPFAGLPLAWCGRFLTRHELAILDRLAGLEGVPRVIARYESTGFAYAYIAGWTLDHEPAIPDHFFEQLSELLRAIHKRKVVYVDMNKRGNIIVGDDGRPHLIDYQISLYLPGVLLTPLRRLFERADIYHITKHKLRLAPHLAAPADFALGRPGLMIRLHRLITAPYRAVRRAVLRYLYSRQILDPSRNYSCSHENNPSRYLR